MRSGPLIWPDLEDLGRESGASVMEIKVLAEDIRDNGMRHPVLVNEKTGEIIDGIKRIEAYAALGWSVIPANYVTDPSEAATAIAEAREGELFPLLRAADIVESLRVLLYERKRSRRGTKTVGEGARPCISRALGTNGTDAVRYVAMRNRLKENPSDIAKDVLPLVDSGEITVSVGYKFVLRGWIDEKPPTPKASPEATDMIRSIIRTIGTTTHQLERAGGVGGIEADDIAQLIKTLLVSKKEINKALIELRKKINGTA